MCLVSVVRLKTVRYFPSFAWYFCFVSRWVQHHWLLFLKCPEKWTVSYGSFEDWRLLVLCLGFLFVVGFPVPSLPLPSFLLLWARYPLSSLSLRHLWRWKTISCLFLVSYKVSWLLYGRPRSLISSIDFCRSNLSFKLYRVRFSKNFKTRYSSKVQKSKCILPKRSRYWLINRKGRSLFLNLMCHQGY